MGAAVRRIWVVPLALAAAVGAVAVYAAGGQPGPEAAVLAGDNLRARTGEHLRLSAVSTALAVAVALPAGLAITRRAGRRLAPAVLWVATLGQTVPT
ncbi:MAG: ABC transporter permease, partial [Acidimicrobiia bacterium]